MQSEPNLSSTNYKYGCMTGLISFYSCVESCERYLFSESCSKWYLSLHNRISFFISANERKERKDMRLKSQSSHFSLTRRWNDCYSCKLSTGSRWSLNKKANTNLLLRMLENEKLHLHNKQLWPWLQTIIIALSLLLCYIKGGFCSAMCGTLPRFHNLILNQLPTPWPPKSPK